MFSTSPHARISSLAILEHPERMEAAATAGGAVSVIDGLSAGYETVLGPTFGGRDLSGGEWQRIATARGFHAGNPLVGCPR